jgi:ATP-dependent Lon protease
MRAGIQIVIFPKLNEKDLFGVPEEAQQTRHFIPVENVDGVFRTKEQLEAAVA